MQVDIENKSKMEKKKYILNLLCMATDSITIKE